MAEKVVEPTYARYCVVGPAGTPGGLRETVRLMNDDNSMRPVADVLGDLNEMIWDAFQKEWRKAYDRRRYKAEALAKIKRNSLPWMEGGFHTSSWMRVDCKESNSKGPQVKFKFTASATCAVLSQNGSKRSAVLGIRQGNSELWVPIGNVTIPANFPIPPAGALVEVRYLYAYPGGALYSRYTWDRVPIRRCLTTFPR